MVKDLRHMGIDGIDDVPWGTHLCHFYEIKEDLIEILVPYLKAGLDNNEFCIWITSEPLKVQGAKAALRKAVPDLDRYVESGQIEILDASQWYTKTGKPEADTILRRWLKKEEHALERGFDGLRATGNTFWLQMGDWKDFCQYEGAVHGVIKNHRMIAICSYSLDKCGASCVIDVVSNHELALIRREGVWETIKGTERKQAREALRESQEKYRSLIECTEDPVYLISRDLSYLHANRKLSSRFGVSPDEIVGREYKDFHSAETTNEFSKKVEEVYRSGKSLAYEHKSQRDGRYFLRTLSPVLNPSTREIEALTVFSKDITDRKRAEEQLKRYKEIVENANDALFMKDLKSNYTLVNNKVLELFGGISRDKIEGKNDKEIMPLDDALHNIKDDRKVFKTGKHQDFIKKNTIDGKDYWFHTTKIPVKDDEGKIVGLIGIARDITDRTKAEEALKESREYANNIIDSSLDMIIAVDNNRRITVFNNAAEDTFGYHREDVLGKHVNLLYADTKQGLRVHQTTIKHGRHTQEILNRRKSGEIFPVLLSASVLLDSAARRVGIMGVSRDITESKKAEEQIKASLREKEILLKEVNHRVKNNLQIISSLLSLQSESIEDEEIHKMFEASQNRVKSMALIHEKLYQSEDFTNVDFGEYMRSLADDLFQFYRIDASEIELKMEIERVSLGVDRAIPCGLIVNELVTNSLKHAFPLSSSSSREGTEVGPGQIRIALKPMDENAIELLVSDNGIGIPEDIDYRSTKSLGLYLVTMLAEKQLGGKIELDRSRGTRIRIVFDRET